MQLFGRNRHGPEIGGGLCPFLVRGDWVTDEHKVPWAEAYLITKWHLDASSCLATINGPKIFEGGVFRPLFGDWVGSRSNTKSPGLMPTCVLSIPS